MYGAGADHATFVADNTQAANSVVVAWQTAATPPCAAQQVFSTVLQPPVPNILDSEANTLGRSGPPNSDGVPKNEPLGGAGPLLPK